jgi:hypothetical protein
MTQIQPGSGGVPNDRIAIGLALLVYAIFAATLGYGMHYPLGH